MENTMRTRRNRFITENSPRRKNSKRWFIFFHMSNLHRRSMRSQQNIRIGFYEKGILHISCRMVFWQIKCRKIMPIIFYFWPICNRKTNRFKNLYNSVFYQINRMSRTQFQRKSWFRKIFFFDNNLARSSFF